MDFYSRKPYALLYDFQQADERAEVWNQLSGLKEQVEIFKSWWKDTNNLPQAIASRKKPAEVAVWEGREAVRSLPLGDSHQTA